MEDGETPEIVGLAVRPMSTRRRVVLLTVGACLAALVALLAIPRVFDDTSKGATQTRPDAHRTELLRALGRETTARTDARLVMDGLEFASMERHSYPTDLAALNSALGQYHRTLAPGDSVAWYVHDDTGYVYCVEHRTGRAADAYALYASTAGNVVETDHGRGCMKAPADYAAAEAAVAAATGGP